MNALPVSVKGVVVCDGKVVLLENERDEWELPGGRQEPGETSQQCVVREIAEELGIDVTVGEMIDTWVYEVEAGKRVTILTFGILPVGGVKMAHSPEHQRLGTFAPDEIAALAMPAGYKASITRWIKRLAAS